jgi:hypothetical protein
VKALLAVMFLCLAVTVAHAGGATVTTQVPIPTQWSKPIVLPNGQVVPSVPTAFETRSSGVDFSPGTAAGTGGPAQPAKVVTNFGVAIILAANNQDMATVKKLLDLGADVNTANSVGATALMAATFRGNAELVTFLLDKHADINQASSPGKTALIYAAQYNHPDLIKLLLKRGADPKSMDETGKTALDYAVESKNADLIAALNGAGVATK